MKPIITVVIPTYNRPKFLYQSLASVLNQKFTNMQILILDNNSNVDLLPIIHRFKDKRIRFIKNSKNLGIICNWNKAIDLCKTKYLAIFHDDDIMLPDFINNSINVLENHKSVGMSYAHANKVDKNLNYLSLWSPLFPKEGLIKGLDYIFYTVKQGCCITIAPTIVFRRSIFNKIGKFNDNLCFNSFDFNMWLRIANYYDIYFINKVLVNYRIHKNQMSETYWRANKKIKGRLATILELQEAISLLLNHKSIVINKKQVNFLKNKFRENNKLASMYARTLIKDL